MFRVMRDSKASHLASYKQFEVHLPRVQEGLTLSLSLISHLILSHSRGNETNTITARMLAEEFLMPLIYIAGH